MTFLRKNFLGRKIMSATSAQEIDTNNGNNHESPDNGKIFAAMREKVTIAPLTTTS